MTRYLYLCFLINFVLFFIPILNNLYYFFIVKEYECGKNYDDTFFFIISLSASFGAYALIHALVIVFSKKIETFYRFRNPLVIIFFVILFVIFFIINKIIKSKGKNNIIYKNIERQKNISNKISLVEKYIKYFEKESEDYYNSKEKDNTIKNTLDLLKQIKNELELMYTAVDVNIVTQSFKDIELQANSLDQLQTELDKMKAYRSLSDISCELEDLMKKFDKK